MSSGTLRSIISQKFLTCPEKNCSTHITDRQIYFGGGAANIAAGIAKLGEESTLISCVGGDFTDSDYDQLDEEPRNSTSSFLLCLMPTHPQHLCSPTMPGTR